MMRPKATADNVRISPARPWGWHVTWPASKRGRSVFAFWRPTLAEAEKFRDSLIT
jgi:hypothetical protein